MGTTARNSLSLIPALQKEVKIRIEEAGK